MSKSITTLLTLIAACSISTVQAQVNAADSVMNHVKRKPLKYWWLWRGGVLTQFFYSDNQFRYRRPKLYAKDPSNGRFDIPHAVIYLGYDFGKGWSLGTEIEF